MAGISRHFIYYPEDKEVTFYTDHKTWIEAVSTYNFFDNHCCEAWDYGVDEMIAGIIPEGIGSYADIPDQVDIGQTDFYKKYQTHKAVQIDRVDMPEDMDEEGYSESLGYHWNPDFEYTCNYRFEAIEPESAGE